LFSFHQFHSSWQQLESSSGFPFITNLKNENNLKICKFPRYKKRDMFIVKRFFRKNDYSPNGKNVSN